MADSSGYYGVPDPGRGKAVKTMAIGIRPRRRWTCRLRFIWRLSVPACSRQRWRAEWRRRSIACRRHWLLITPSLPVHDPVEKQRRRHFLTPRRTLSGDPRISHVYLRSAVAR